MQNSYQNLPDQTNKAQAKMAATDTNQMSRANSVMLVRQGGFPEQCHVYPRGSALAAFKNNDSGAVQPWLFPFQYKLIPR